MWSACRSSSQRWSVFALLEVDTTLGDGCGIWEHLLSFRKVKCLRVIPRFYGWVYKILRLYQLLVELFVPNQWVPCVHYYCPHKYVPARTISFLTYLSHKVKKSRFIYQGLVTIYTGNLSRYRQEFNTLKEFKICDCILLISKRPFILCIF